MSMMLSFLLLFILPILTKRYCQTLKDVAHPQVWSSKAHGRYIFLTLLSFFSLLVLDILTILGVFDPILLWWSSVNPFVNLPAVNTGPYYYFNCILLGFINLYVPINLAS
ncbi:MAG: hypothetical protein ACTSSI_14350 [Candidatus Helarchaeota archaeon]